MSSLLAVRPIGMARPAAPHPIHRRIEVHDHVVHRIRRLLQRAGYAEVSIPPDGALPHSAGRLRLEEAIADGSDAVYGEGGATDKWMETVKRDMTLSELCTFQERLLKEVAVSLSADQIGGGNVTRLDRMLRCEHPRMTYRDAMAILSRRGFDLEFGADLDAEAEGALIYHCGNLPIHITHSPVPIAPHGAKIDRSDSQVVEGVDYVLPFSGRTFGGWLRETDADLLHRRPTSPTGASMEGCGVLSTENAIERAGVSLSMGRLLYYLVGLDQ